ncbi:MAG: EamA family transporter [Pedosphaera sp.]|nr:EamA family transporter [Pedosphaera sp.]MSS99692.1 EamA family transporter [Pedosphaera sp.]
MLGAVLATILFSCSGVSGRQLVKWLPGTEVNFWRLTLATLLLGAWAHTMGGGLGGGALAVFLISGAIGFGFGDIALFQTYPRLGTRLTMMMVNCLAAPFAALIEWMWLGNSLNAAEVTCGVVILAGVGTALAPGENPHIERLALRAGITFGTLAALGQGLGAVLSRKAYEVAEAAGQPVDGITAAYQRILGGLFVTALFLLFLRRKKIFGAEEPVSPSPALTQREKWRAAAPWLVFNALVGPTLGVSCYQWALLTKGTGVVLPIIAITPLTVIPFAVWMGEERPSRRALIGGVVAVAGAVALVLVSR